MTDRQGTSPWVWVLLISLLLSFTLFILFLDQKIASKTSPLDPAQQATRGKNKPTIDFYSVLPQRKIEIPITKEEQAGIENPTINKEAGGKAILQVGSFQSAADADSLKAQLAFLGLQARVESAIVGSDTWHRVQLGPFDSNSRLSQAKNLLIENRIKYIQRVIP